MRTLKVLVAIAIAVPMLAASATAAEGDRFSGQTLSGDIITAVVPFWTFYIAHGKDDSHGEGQFLRSTGASLVLNSLLRVGFNETSLGKRPNGSPYGFPSGHTAFMTSSAAFLQDRYGWHYGLPAYVLSGYVAWVRVDTGHHRWRDVAAGAALSWSVSKLLVTPYDSPQITPVIGPKHVGLQWQKSF